MLKCVIIHIFDTMAVKQLGMSYFWLKKRKTWWYVCHIAVRMNSATQTEQGTNTARRGNLFFLYSSNVCTLPHCKAARIKALNKWFYVKNTCCSQWDSLFKPSHPACLHDWQLVDKLIQRRAGTKVRQSPTFLPHVGHRQTASCCKCCLCIWTLVVRVAAPASCKI